jgi:signal peptidase II
MNKKASQTRIVVAIIFGVLIIDQIVKIWIKTHLSYGEEFLILGQEWARIHFVENEGMAFGLSFGGAWGKLILSLFRVGAAIFLIYLIRSLIKIGERTGLLVSIALIFAGAVGNIIDSIFYGLIFSASTYHGDPAVLFPEGGGYGSVLMGKVVDMFYFPMIDTRWPEWLPFIGGDRFEFFRPVFNVADSAITVGVFLLLLFYRDFFKSKKEK